MLRSSNSDTIKESSNKVGDTNDDRDYDAIIKQSTTALAEIYRTQHIALLDKRAFALGMKSQFREGLKDAQAMIKYAPDLITGYLRLGDLYLRQGMSRAAIDIYDRGLENLHPPAPPLPLPQQNGETNSSLVADDPKSYYIQLINARKAAVKQHESRIDFIQRLSTELTMNIFMHLPLSAKVICTQVSRIWRTKILRCSVAWRVIICDKSLTTDTSTAVCNLVARNDALGIGSHIRRLVLHCNDFSSENNNMKICQTYLDSMMNLRLTNIQELSISGSSFSGFEREHIAISFWQIRQTLQKLTLDLGDIYADSPSVITIAGVLRSCSNLKSFSYKSNLSMDAVAGDVSKLNLLPTLISLDIRVQHMEAHNFAPLLLKCPNIQRLDTKARSYSIVDSVYKHCPLLEILSFTSILPLSVEQLLSRQQQEKNLQNNESSRLRVLNMSSNEEPTPCGLFMPLIYKNRNTLEHMTVKFSRITDPEEAQQLLSHYADLKFPIIRSFTGWMYAGLQSIFLPALCTSTVLETMCVSNIMDLPAFVDALCSLPPLRELMLYNLTTPTYHIPQQEDAEDNRHGGGRVEVNDSNNYNNGEHQHQQRGMDLVRLFNKYSEYGLDCSLERVEFIRAVGLTDSVLVALAGIPKLKKLVLKSCRDSDSFTGIGLESFVDHMQSGVLESLELYEMDIAQDAFIAKLSKLSSLQSITLTKVKNVTDSGIVRLVDHVIINKENSGGGDIVLNKLILNNCRSISHTAIRYAREKLPWVNVSYS